LTAPLAGLLKTAGFIQPRISLETVDTARQRSTGGKVSGKEFEQAIINLRNAGYKPGEYIAYLLMGMPGQRDIEIEESIRWAHRLGAHISLSEYSLIPGTSDWENYRQLLPHEDPLWQNNTLLPLTSRSELAHAQKLKDLVHELNQTLRMKGT
jgi:molybdenum cofactor biosynthesis enzyme MoaA